jgi:uncharacterized damage-inducible protein DinB
MSRSPRNVPTEPEPSVDAIVRALEEMYRGPAWHGPSVRFALKGVTAKAAAWRPAAGRNSIHDLVLHLAYARHRLMQRVNALQGRTTPRFPRKMRTTWFPEVPARVDAEAWAEDLKLLEGYQERVLATVADAAPEVLGTRRGREKRSVGAELMGLAFHDAYHAGQIRLLSLMASKKLRV